MGARYNLTPMKTLFFGGSYNPIHHGHLICARAAAEAAGFAKVVLIPGSQPPHKPTRELAPAQDRLAMCRLAVAGSSLFEVSDVEMTREGPSYTLVTVRQLKRHGHPAIHWLVGADMLRDLPNWYEVRALTEEAEFVVMARPGWRLDGPALPPPLDRVRATVVQAPLIEISGSDIRRRVAAGLPIDYLTPAAVVDYIRERRLYLRAV